jgi:hypothetical protein
MSATWGSSLPDPCLMAAGEVQRELRGYDLATSNEVRSDLQFLERRARLWRRLDHLVAAWQRRLKAQQNNE